MIHDLVLAAMFAITGAGLAIDLIVNRRRRRRSANRLRHWQWSEPSRSRAEHRPRSQIYDQDSIA